MLLLMYTLFDNLTEDCLVNKDEMNLNLSIIIKWSWGNKLFIYILIVYWMIATIKSLRDKG